MLIHDTVFLLIRDNDHRLAKTIEDSIVFAAKRQAWQRMIQRIIRPMLIAMNIWQNSHAVLLRRKAARREKLFGFSPSYNHYNQQPVFFGCLYSIEILVEKQDL